MARVRVYQSSLGRVHTQWHGPCLPGYSSLSDAVMPPEQRVDKWGDRLKWKVKDATWQVAANIDSLLWNQCLPMSFFLAFEQQEKAEVLVWGGGREEIVGGLAGVGQGGKEWKEKSRNWIFCCCCLLNSRYWASTLVRSKHLSYVDAAELACSWRSWTVVQLTRVNCLFFDAASFVEEKTYSELIKCQLFCSFGPDKELLDTRWRCHSALLLITLVLFQYIVPLYIFIYLFCLCTNW